MWLLLPFPKEDRKKNKRGYQRITATIRRLKNSYIMKYELLYTDKFESFETFAKALERHIYHYNNKRIKLRLDRKSPAQYQTLSKIR
ncbi:IS3 family transposase [Hoylesella oralis]|uniref:IS3 family transposase n=1 Tax=Hoylesella oralis TaxID=28134 RepID=UPI00093BF1D7